MLVLVVPRGARGPRPAAAIAQEPHPRDLVQGQDLGTASEVRDRAREKALDGLADPHDKVRGMQCRRLGGTHLVGVGRRDAGDDQPGLAGLSHHAGHEGVDRLDAHHHPGRGARGGSAEQGEDAEQGTGRPRADGASPSFPLAIPVERTGAPGRCAAGFRPRGRGCSGGKCRGVFESRRRRAGAWLPIGHGRLQERKRYSITLLSYNARPARNGE